MSSKSAILILAVIAIIGAVFMFFMLKFAPSPVNTVDTAPVHKTGSKTGETEKDLTTEEKIQILEELMADRQKEKAEAGQVESYEDIQAKKEKLSEIFEKRSAETSVAENAAVQTATSAAETSASNIGLEEKKKALEEFFQQRHELE